MGFCFTMCIKKLAINQLYLNFNAHFQKLRIVTGFWLGVADKAPTKGENKMSCYPTL